MFDCGDIAEFDPRIWAYAVANGFVILTKDNDFQAMSLLFGAPPKIIRLRIGNCPTRDIEALIRTRVADIAAFDSDTTVSLLVLQP